MPAKERDALAEVIEESDRVLAMLTTLTDISEAEAGAMRLDKQPEDLGAIAREAVELYDFVAKDAGVTVVTHLGGDAKVVVDRRRIAQVCANLIDNAIKYTPAGGRVEVSVSRDAPWAVLRIADTGVGIAPDDRRRVWERLFRGDRSRGRTGSRPRPVARESGRRGARRRGGTRKSGRRRLDVRGPVAVRRLDRVIRC